MFADDDDAQAPVVSMSKHFPDLIVMIGLHLIPCDDMPGHAMCCDAVQWNKAICCDVNVTVLSLGLGLTAMRCVGGSMLVTGGRDGTINVWSCHRGRHLQTIHKAHLTNAHSSKGAPMLLFCSQVSAVDGRWTCLAWLYCFKSSWHHPASFMYLVTPEPTQF